MSKISSVDEIKDLFKTKQVVPISTFFFFFEKFIKLIKQQPNTFDTWSLKVKSIDEINFLPLVFVQVSRAIAELE